MDTINIHIMGVQGKERQNGAESLYQDTMTRNLTTWGRKWTSNFKKLKGLQLDEPKEAPSEIHYQTC